MTKHIARHHGFFTHLVAHTAHQLHHIDHITECVVHPHLPTALILGALAVFSHHSHAH